jgi:3-oxoacyl-[acyl-carrier-protein] synthase-1
MNSALGPDVVSGCAAARAGLSRARELAEMEVLDPVEGAPVPVLVHQVPGAEGFTGLGRLIRLGVGALDDMVGRAGISARELAESACILNLPSGYYGQMADGMVVSAEGETRFPDRPVPLDGAELRERISDHSSRLAPRLFELAAAGTVPAYVEILVGDQAGCAASLRLAIELIAGGRFPRCLVGGIDSFVDRAVLEKLAVVGVLATPANPVGFMPGEGAAFVLIERDDVAARRGAERLAVPEAPSFLGDDPHQLSEESPSGRTLTAAILQTLGGCPDQGTGTGLVVGTCNGTYWSALEWGAAQVQLPLRIGQSPQWFPAESFGETGAAAGLMACCVATRALQRGYAPSPKILSWFSSGRGEKGAVRLSHPSAVA